MISIGSQLRKRQQHEGALVHARMRHRQPGLMNDRDRRTAADRDRACAPHWAPSARGPAALRAASKASSSSHRRELGAQRRHGIDEIGLIGLADRGAAIQRRAREQLRARQDATSASNGLAQLLPRIFEIAPEPDVRRSGAGTGVHLTSLQGSPRCPRAGRGLRRRRLRLAPSRSGISMRARSSSPAS